VRRPNREPASAAGGRLGIWRRVTEAELLPFAQRLAYGWFHRELGSGQRGLRPAGRGVVSERLETPELPDEPPGVEGTRDQQPAGGRR
jgi:hypothetical protein